MPFLVPSLKRQLSKLSRPRQHRPLTEEQMHLRALSLSQMPAPLRPPQRPHL
jgi:hypothetical protein